MKNGDILRTRVRALSFGGDSIGDAPDGRVLFLSGGVPGDLVEARLTEVKARFGRGEVVRVVEAGAERVPAKCELFGRCGGCQWQDVSLPAQRAAKQEIVQRALGRLGAEVRPIVTPTESFGYRTRARFTVGASAIGYQARRSHEVVDVAHCPLLDPALDRAMQEARRVMGPAIQSGGTIAGLVGRDEMVHIALTGVREGAKPDQLIGMTGIVGVVADGIRMGAPGVDIADVGESPFMAAADGFAQAAHSGNSVLREIVRNEAGGPHGRILELFAGDGNFTRDLAQVSNEIVAVEGESTACKRLGTNVNGPAKIVIHAESAESAAEQLAKSGERFDLVVLDPPRAGAPLVAQHLPSLTSRVVYISCDPMTLARDAKTLAERGLRPVRATPIDLMPHTWHIETVCSFARD